MLEMGDEKTGESRINELRLDTLATPEAEAFWETMNFCARWERFAR